MQDVSKVNNAYVILVAGSPWRDKLSLAILELQEKGMIQLMYNKWWKNTGDVCNRDDKKDSKASLFVYLRTIR